MAETRERSEIASEGGGRVEITAVVVAVSVRAGCCFWERRVTETRVTINCELVIMFCFDDE